MAQIIGAGPLKGEAASHLSCTFFKNNPGRHTHRPKARRTDSFYPVSMPTPPGKNPAPGSTASPITYPDTLTVQPIGRLDATVAIPGSKSLTNRALLLAALAKGKSTLTNVLFADDSRRMLEALQTLGFDLTIDEANTTVTITGAGGRFPNQEADLFLGNAGTAVRFLTAALCLGPSTGQTTSGGYKVRGIPRMHERPIGQLVEPLRQLGATIDYDGNDGYPPLTIRVKQPLPGAQLTMAPTLSSQYISALLQTAPCMPEGLTITFDGPVISKPYVEMTLKLMAQFGAEYETDAAMSFITVKGQNEGGGYQATNTAIEPDASNATYFLAMAAVTGGRCTVPHLGINSLQGDAGFARVLEQMGCQVEYTDDSITVHGTDQLRGVDVDLNAMPDTAQTLAAVACFADGPTTMRDIGNLRVKETDRMAAVQNEWTKLGVKVEINGDDMTVHPPAAGADGKPKFQAATLETYDDHRMAMSLSVIAVGAQGQPGVVTLEDPGCCAKTFPTFFEQLTHLRHP